MKDLKLCDCGHPPSEHAEFTTGYGTDSDGKTACYACCAEKDKERMIQTGRAVLYLSNRKITNWPGSLSFDVSHISKGRHNIARTRYDAWFTGPDGKNWHAVQYGDMTQIAHCRRVK